MVDNNKEGIKHIELWLIGTLFLVSIIAVIAFLINDRSKGNEVIISGTEDVEGLRCINNDKMSFIFQDYRPIAHTNTITAAFMSGKLNSLTYAYEGQYTDNEEADHARDFGEADYGLNLTDNLNLDITTFTKNMSVSGDKVYFTVTASDDTNLNSKTAPIFMLSDDKTFPTTLEGMKMAYESVGFSCSVDEN